MQVTNLINDNGNAVKNQFVIQGEHYGQTWQFFKSYDTVIAFKPNDGSSITLDRDNWNYSNTTSRHRNTFLNENIAQTRAKIKSGEYILTDLNGG